MFDLLIIFLASFIFSLFDYYGYNIIVVKQKQETFYRKLQVLVQIIIFLLLILIDNKSYLDYKKYYTSLGFIFIWWTWCDDWFFYIIDFCLSKLKLGYGIGKDELKKVFNGITKVSWAWWTIIGLLFYKKNEVIPFKILKIQSLIALIVTLLIKILFI